MALVYAQTKPPDTYLSLTVIFPACPFPHSMHTLLAGNSTAVALPASQHSKASPPSHDTSLQHYKCFTHFS